MPVQKKVVVIGGGIVGLCTAYYLARDGVETTLLEREAFCGGASIGSAGMIAPSHFIPLAAPGAVTQGLKWMFNPQSPFYIRPRPDPSLWSWLWRFRGAANEQQMRRAMPLLKELCQASLRLYEQFALTEGLEFGFEKRGLLMLYNSAQGERHGHHEANLASEVGIEASVLSTAELQKIDHGARFTASGGVYFPGDAHLSPARFCACLSAVLAGMGVTVRLRTSVLGFDTSGGEIERLKTSDGALVADEYVLAAGSWSSGLAETLGHSLPLQPGKGYSLTLEHPPVRPTIPSILTEARVAVTPMGSTLRLAGTMELSGLDLTVDYRRVNAIVNALPHYYAGFNTAAVDRSGAWAGLRPCSPDGLPYLGRFSSPRNLIAATGHAMLGLTLGPVTGHIVADFIAGRTPARDIALLRPERYS